MIIIPGTSLPALSNPGAAADLKNGKQLIDANGNVLTGTMSTITLPTPGITVSSQGLITASYEADAGYTSGGSKSGTKQLTTQAGTTITPGSSQKTAVANGRYTTGTVYVAGDSNLKASNIKSGVNIFGVTGTLESLKAYIILLESGNISPYRSSGNNYIYRVPFLKGGLPSGATTNFEISAFAIHLINMYTATASIMGPWNQSVDEGAYVNGSPFVGFGGVSFGSNYFQCTISQMIVNSTMEASSGNLYVGEGSFFVLSEYHMNIN